MGFNQTIENYLPFAVQESSQALKRESYVNFFYWDPCRAINVVKYFCKVMLFSVECGTSLSLTGGFTRATSKNIRVA